MKEVLESLLPRLLPSYVSYRFVCHSGKSDLQKSLPRKLRGWNEPDVRFVIVQDQDSADCRELKGKLYNMCCENNRPDSLVRIVCRELEAWFLADLAAVEKGMNVLNLADRQDKETYRFPDTKNNASQLLKKLVPAYQKRSGARGIAPHLDLSNTRSPNFHAFVSGIRRLVEDSSRL